MPSPTISALVYFNATQYLKSKLLNESDLTLGEKAEPAISDCLRRYDLARSQLQEELVGREPRRWSRVANLFNHVVYRSPRHILH
jgi:hypothetical protein